MLADRAGRRALAISLAGLLVTAAVQAVIVAVSGSIGLLADTIHNFADALTALPIGLAFWVARRPATRRYTYGYGRPRIWPSLAVVAVMTASVAIAAWQAIERLVHPRPVHELIWVAAAGAAGFAGNELAARYRIRSGRVSARRHWSLTGTTPGPTGSPAWPSSPGPAAWPWGGPRRTPSWG